MMKKCNLVELFSGIGSQAKALKNLGIQVNTIGTCEWDVHAIAAYDLIHNSADIPENILAMEKKELLEVLKPYTFSNSGKVPLSFSSLCTYSKESLQRIYTSVTRNKNFVDISTMRGDTLPGSIDILTYSFPCQDLSNVGAFHGYNKGIDRDSGSRSSLLWQVGRILSEMETAGITLPKFLVMENVPTLLSTRHKANFDIWINELETLGYVSKYYPLNALSFGLPQNRPRLLMLSVFVGKDEGLKYRVQNYFESKSAEGVVADYKKSRYFKEYTVENLLRINYGNKKLRAEAEESTPNDTVSRKKIWEDNPQIVLPGHVFNKELGFIRTITTKQDRNPNSGNLYFESAYEGRSKFRYLTPRECLLFMGFTDDDFKVLKKNNVEFHKGDALFARDKVIRMAGNSIPVKLLEGIFLQVSKLNELIEEYRCHDPLLINDEKRVEHYSKIIRSYLFSSGIRSRLNKEICPKGAHVVYPKYRTAIFIKECFWQRQAKGNAEIPAANDAFWELTATDEDGVLKTCVDETVDMGWNALVLSTVDLTSEKQEQALAWIADEVRKNKRPNKSKGLVLTYG